MYFKKAVLIRGGKGIAAAANSVNDLLAVAHFAANKIPGGLYFFTATLRYRNRIC